MKIMRKLMIGTLVVVGVTGIAKHMPQHEGLEMIDMNKEIEQRVVEDKKRFDEKATEWLYNWKESPVGTESPYDNEDGTNPVYDGMLEEEHGKPDDSKTPFYNEKTGEKVVEENVRRELDERRNSPETSTFENPFAD